MNRSQSATLVFVALLLALPDAGADERPADPVDVITVTGTRTAHLISDAPVTTQVITREEIERRTNLDVGRVLDEIPDIYVRQNDEFRLGASTVRMQGADANKVAILLNGRRFRGGVDGVVDLRDIPVDMIDRIEILRGPASSLYGSDAMAGVVNIITRKPGPVPEAQARIGGGTFGRLLGSASISGRHGPFSGFASYVHDELELAQQFGEISEQFAGDAADAKQKRDDVFLDLGYDLNDRHRVGFTGNYNPVREGPESERTNASANGVWQWNPRTGTDAELAAGWYGFRRGNDLPGFQEDVDYGDTFAELRGSHAATNGLWRESHLLTLGHRFRAETLVSRAQPDMALQFDDIDASATLYSGYAQDEIALGDAWSLVVGASVDAHEFYGAEVNPRAHLSWRPDERFRVSAGIGRGYRAPDLRQLFDVDANSIVRSGNAVRGYVILGNHDLDPETGIGETVHADFRPVAGLSATLGLFRHDFDDLIEVALLCAGPRACSGGFETPFPELSGQVFRYENVGAAVTQGVDVGVRLEPLTLLGAAEAIDHLVEVSLQYGYLHTRNESDRPGESGKELPFRPPHRFLPSILYAYEPWGTGIRLTAEYEDRTYTDLANTPGFIADAHWLFGAHARWTPPPALLPAGGWPSARSEPLTLFVEATNLFDTEFGIPTPMGNFAGRRMIVAGLQLRL